MLERAGLLWLRFLCFTRVYQSINALVLPLLRPVRQRAGTSRWRWPCGEKLQGVVVVPGDGFSGSRIG